MPTKCVVELTDSANEVYEIKDAEARRSRVFVGTCDTTAGTAAKVATVDSDFTLEKGREIAIKFTYTNSAANPTLSVGGTTAASIFYDTAVITSANKGIAGTENRYIYYIYDGTNWVFEGWSIDYDTNTTYTNVKLGNGLAVQNNSQSATAITAALTDYVLSAHGRVSVEFKYDVPASATLNINGQGGKNIQYYSAATTLSNVPANIIKAGDVATFVYNGSVYVLTGLIHKTLNWAVSGSTTASTTGTASPSVTGSITIGTGSGTANYTPAGSITNGAITIGSGTNASNLLTKSSTFTVTPTAATTAKLTASLAANSVVTGSSGTSSNMITSDTAPVDAEFLTGISVASVVKTATAANIHAAAAASTVTITTGASDGTTIATGGSMGSAAAQGHTHSVPASTATAIAAYNSVSSTTYKKPTTASQTAPSWSVTATLVQGTTEDYNLSFNWNAGTVQATVATGGWSDGTSSNGVISAISFGTGNAAPSNHTHTASATDTTAQSVVTSVTTTKITALAAAQTITLSKPSGTTASGDVSVIGSVTTGAPTVTPTTAHGVGFASAPTLSRANAVAGLSTGAPTITLGTTTDTGGVQIPTNAISGASVAPASNTTTETAIKTLGTISQGTSSFSGTGVQLTATPSLTVSSHSHSIPTLTVSGTAE